MARRIHPCDDPPPIRSQFDPDAIAIPPLTALISRWIHRRAVIGFLLLPWLTLVLALGGLAAVDLLLGDGVLAQQWAQEPRRELLRQLGLDLLWIVGALYLLGALPWLACRPPHTDIAARRLRGDGCLVQNEPAGAVAHGVDELVAGCDGHGVRSTLMPRRPSASWQ